ncbi:hypothetical protein ACSBOB_00840 [Mesorhizobium sp. ASY16-5R]|uniref:hypothetical protein n=1 Tax=Mesorhizobium sp. ASY16-5R TaxID=3445772 RepID=UPI003FA15139
MPNTAVPAAGGALPTAQPTTFLAVTPTMRLRIATTIENLMALLDEIDGDENLEPYLATYVGNGDDREGDLDVQEGDNDTDAEDTGDEEPDLGFSGIATGWRRRDEGEEGDGFVEGENDEDMEPNGDAEDERITSNCPVADYCEIAFRKPDGIIVREVVSC